MRHLAARFLVSLSPAGPAPADDQWARASLLDGERRLWERMSGPDRRHAVGVARNAARLLGTLEPPRAVVAAALLHDVGKVEASIGTLARAAVTLVALTVGRERLVQWSGASSVSGRASSRQRAGLYLTHDRLGARLLTAAGSDELTVAWAGEHHLAPERWSVAAPIGVALKAADRD